MRSSASAALRHARRLARKRFTDPSGKRGLLVAFEGPDGSGKTTQRKLFKTWLKSEGYDVVTTKWNSSDLIKPIIKSRKAVRALSPEELTLDRSAVASMQTGLVAGELSELVRRKEIVDLPKRYY